jgi:hypothetical protein
VLLKVVKAFQARTRHLYCALCFGRFLYLF